MKSIADWMILQIAISSGWLKRKEENAGWLQFPNGFFIRISCKSSISSAKGRLFQKAMAGALIRNKVQVHDEHQLLAPLRGRFKGYEDPENIKSLAQNAFPYLPYYGALGEMVLNTGGAIHYFRKGADGIIDISPFTCMNGIVCEAVYPRVSRDHDHVPIRNFYFDGTQTDLERDVEIFLELAHSYMKRKKMKRIYPSHFH